MGIFSLLEVSIDDSHARSVRIELVHEVEIGEVEPIYREIPSLRRNLGGS